MATSKSQEREAREARERLKRYNARQTVHATQVKRRKRDNIVAIAGVIIVAAAAAAVQVFYFTSGPGMPVPEPTASASATPAAEGENVGNVPDPATSEAREWTGALRLNDTRLSFTLDGKAAPQGVASFIADIKSGYFLDKTCHRLEVQEGAQLIQCGSVDGTGASDPEYAFGPLENVPADNVYKTGTIALARGATPYSQGHQFFITYGDSTLQDAAGGYTVIGTVTAGLDDLGKNIIDAGAEVDPATGTSAPKIATTITGATVK